MLSVKINVCLKVSELMGFFLKNGHKLLTRSLLLCAMIQKRLSCTESWVGSFVDDGCAVNSQ